MKAYLRKALHFLVFLFISQQGFAETSVWLVSKGEHKVYLGGTVHMLRSSDYPLPDSFEKAYSDSSSLYFETDIDQMSDPATQLNMLQEVMYSDGRSISKVLNNEAYGALSDYVSTLGLPMMLLENMKPGMLVSTLEVMEFQKMGFNPQGVDLYFHTRAKAEGKTIDSFETVEQQIGFIASMGEGEESEFVLLSLRDMGKIQNEIEVMISTWRTGNADGLADLFVDDMQSMTPKVYKMLLLDRNNNWLPKIEAMFDDADTEFVLVGVAHLLGKDGLVEQLRTKGYQIEQL